MKDKIYRSDNERIKPFEFNDEVTSVFSDMINRSVPGYELITSLMPVIAEKYAQSNSNIYDLGCSLGAVSFAIRNKIIDSEIKIIAIDSSKSMINSCKKNIEKKKVELPIEFIIDDILNIKIKNSSLVIMNFSLQFIPVEQRDELINKIFNSLLPGGVLILSEKIFSDSDFEDDVTTQLHFQMKKMNGYDESEIARKREALENVLMPESIDSHFSRLKRIGFEKYFTWFKCFNFASIIAFK